MKYEIRNMKEYSERLPFIFHIDSFAFGDLI
jgi:hypothetical protein